MITAFRSWTIRIILISIKVKNSPAVGFRARSRRGKDAPVWEVQLVEDDEDLKGVYSRLTVTAEKVPVNQISK